MSYFKGASVSSRISVGCFIFQSYSYFLVGKLKGAGARPGNKTKRYIGCVNSIYLKLLAQCLVTGYARKGWREAE